MAKTILVGGSPVRFSGHFLARWRERVGGPIRLWSWAIREIQSFLAAKPEGFIFRFRLEDKWLVATREEGTLVFVTVVAGDWVKGGPEWRGLTESSGE